MHLTPSCHVGQCCIGNFSQLQPIFATHQCGPCQFSASERLVDLLRLRKKVIRMISLIAQRPYSMPGWLIGQVPVQLQGLFKVGPLYQTIISTASSSAWSSTRPFSQKKVVSSSNPPRKSLAVSRRLTIDSLCQPEPETRKCGCFRGNLLKAIKVMTVPTTTIKQAHACWTHSAGTSCCSPWFRAPAGAIHYFVPALKHEFLYAYVSRCQTHKV